MTLNQIIENQTKRKWAAKTDFRFFFHYYFAHYLKFDTAPFQDEIYKDLQDWNIKYEEIIAFRESAKRQPLDAKVLTPSGFRLMGDLSVGGYVIGSDGNPTRINYISEIVDRPVYVVETEDGRKTECDIEHLWTVRKMTNVKEKVVTVDTKYLIDSGLSYNHAPHWLNGKRYNEYKFAIDTVKPVNLEKKDLPLDPYLLGVLLGDGSFDKATGYARLYFHRDDEGHYRRHLCKYDLSETKYKKENSNGGRFGIKGIGKIIKGLGLNVSARDKFIPNDYLYGSIEQRRAILEGLMDTDGTVNSGTASFTSISEKLVDGVISLVRSLGGRANKSKNVQKVNGNDYISWRVSILFTDYTPFRLERKRVKHVPSTHTFSRIVNISLKGSKKGRCIVVDNDDGLYVTDDYLLTHNSTIVMLGLPIWAIISEKAKFPLLIADTGTQAKQHIYNLKSELENNQTLIRDWGPFQENEEWTTTNIVLPKYDARIIARSTGQKIRGLRHKQYRPDLGLFDDLENIESVRTLEQRDKNERWLTDEAIPALDDNAKKVIIGNLLHSDSLMMRIKKQILDKEIDAVLREYPIIKGDKILWKSKYPNMEAIEKKRRSTRNPSGSPWRTWNREYLLKIIPEEGQVIKESWIKFYDKLPESDIIQQGTGVDLAISKKDTADYTTMVSGRLYEIENDTKLFIMPNPINDRLSGFETTETAKNVSLALGNGNTTQLWVEDVAYQRMQIEAMTKMGLPAMSVKVTSDKRSRLSMAGSYMQIGKILFPRKGCEDLITQLLGFGVEMHDDLVDAFTMLVNKIFESQVNIRFI